MFLFSVIELEGSSSRLEMIVKCRDLLKFQEEQSEFDREISEIKAQMPKESLSEVRKSKMSLSEIRTKTQAKLENTGTQVLETQNRAEKLRERMEEEKTQKQSEGVMFDLC